MEKDNKKVQITFQEVKTHSLVLKKILEQMMLNEIDEKVVNVYSARVWISLFVGVILGSFLAFLISFAIGLTGIFKFSIVVFLVLSMFLLSMFIMKAMMMSLYIKIRKVLRNLSEYETFMKILMKNSYLVYGDELRDELMQKIKEENSRMVNGESFPVSQIFVTSAEDEVLFIQLSEKPCHSWRGCKLLSSLFHKVNCD